MEEDTRSFPWMHSKIKGRNISTTPSHSNSWQKLRSVDYIIEDASIDNLLSKISNLDHRGKADKWIRYDLDIRE